MIGGGAPNAPRSSGRASGSRRSRSSSSACARLSAGSRSRRDRGAARRGPWGDGLRGCARNARAERLDEVRWRVASHADPRPVAAARSERSTDHRQARLDRFECAVCLCEERVVGGSRDIGPAGRELGHPEDPRVRLVPDAHVAERRDCAAKRSRRPRTRSAWPRSEACYAQRSRRRRSARSSSSPRPQSHRLSSATCDGAGARSGADQTALSTITPNPARRARSILGTGGSHFAASSTAPTSSAGRGEPPQPPSESATSSATNAAAPAAGARRHRPGPAAANSAPPSRAPAQRPPADAGACRLLPAEHNSSFR